MPQQSPPEAAPHRRDLDWDGCLNVRDLGGHPTGDGETAFGRVVRADSVHQLSAQGWRSLVDYGIRTVVDLRGDHERLEDPPGELPVEVVHVPFMEANEDDWRSVRADLDAIVASTRDPATIARDFYLMFLERFRENAAAGVRTVARAPEGGVVVHCVGGKDRTGLLCAFLLELAGVSREEIAADYALSEERLRPRLDERTPPEAMLGVLTELDRRYGGVAGYLTEAGLSEEELTLAAGRLR